jgi:hypothetical protein
MTDGLERIWKESVVAYSKQYPIICLEGLRKPTRNLIQDNLCPSRNLNQAYTEYNSRALPLDQPARYHEIG